MEGRYRSLPKSPEGPPKNNQVRALFRVRNPSGEDWISLPAPRRFVKVPLGRPRLTLAKLLAVIGSTFSAKVLRIYSRPFRLFPASSYSLRTARFVSTSLLHCFPFIPTNADVLLLIFKVGIPATIGYLQRYNLISGIHKTSARSIEVDVSSPSSWLK